MAELMGSKLGETQRDQTKGQTMGKSLGGNRKTKLNLQDCELDIADSPIAITCQEGDPHNVSGVKCLSP